MPQWSASAPGKVLICGGYLVVEAPNIGISIGVNARFKSTVTKAAPRDDGPHHVTIVSPQFGATFEFTVTVSSSDVTVAQSAGRESPFLFNAILATFAYLGSAAGAHGLGAPVALEVVLQADNDFYSQRNFLAQSGLPVTAANLRTVPQHAPLVGDVSKTGLGSSAALTTSLVGCIIHYFSDTMAHLDRAAVAHKECIHRVAQVAHSIAQGKIGSGFDVFTAAYGSNVYSRFSPQRVDALMGTKQPTSLAPADVASAVSLDVPWVPARPAFSGLPPRVNLMLADIHQGGSSTPGMVAKIMGWRKTVAGVDGNEWDALARANEEYVAIMAELAEGASSDDYGAAVDDLKRVPCHQWDAKGKYAALFLRMRDLAAKTRGLLRQVGINAEVEVEPPTLTPLLDATLALPGVVAAACPGAGGYDAIYALVLGDVGEMQRVEDFWQNYSGLDVCPLLVREDANSKADESARGVRLNTAE